MGVPKFKTVIGAAKTLEAGTVGGDIIFPTGAGHCSPDSAELDASCANAGKFNDGKSVAVNDAKYRFPYWVSSKDKTKGIDAVAAAYTNCAKNALCIFITIPEPQGRKDMTVNYKFKTQIRTLNVAAENNFHPKDYTVSLAREVSNVNDVT